MIIGWSNTRLLTSMKTKHKRLKLTGQSSMDPMWNLLPSITGWHFHSNTRTSGGRIRIIGRGSRKHKLPSLQRHAHLCMISYPIVDSWNRSQMICMSCFLKTRVSTRPCSRDRCRWCGVKSSTYVRPSTRRRLPSNSSTCRQLWSRRNTRSRLEVVCERWRTTSNNGSNGVGLFSAGARNTSSFFVICYFVFSECNQSVFFVVIQLVRHSSNSSCCCVFCIVSQMNKCGRWSILLVHFCVIIIVVSFPLPSVVVSSVCFRFFPRHPRQEALGLIAYRFPRCLFLCIMISGVWHHHRKVRCRCCQWLKLFGWLDLASPMMKIAQPQRAEAANSSMEHPLFPIRVLKHLTEAYVLWQKTGRNRVLFSSITLVDSSIATCTKVWSLVAVKLGWSQPSRRLSQVF